MFLKAGAGEVGVCEATAATPWSLLVEPLGFFIAVVLKLFQEEAPLRRVNSFVAPPKENS